MSAWAPFALTAITAALLALPVTPALYELWKRGDAAPLPTARHDGRIANFAEAFRARMKPLLPELERCGTRQELSRTSVEGMEVVLVGCNTNLDTDVFDLRSGLIKGATTVMLSAPIFVPAGELVEADVYADSTLELGEGAALRAALGRDDIILGKNSTVLRWLHADKSIHLRQRSSAYGRLSAGQSIRLEPGCCFEHMHAPQILTVDPELGNGSVPSRLHCCEVETDPGKFAAHSAPVIDDAFTGARPRIRIHGNFVLPAGETLNANVIATGELRLCTGSHLFGSAKSCKEIVLEENSCVHGSIVCHETVRLGPRCFVSGPIMAESEVLIDRGSLVGEIDALTTISSCGAKIAAGCQLHGTVWARVRGTVEA